MLAVLALIAAFVIFADQCIFFRFVALTADAAWSAAQCGLTVGVAAVLSPSHALMAVLLVWNSLFRTLLSTPAAYRLACTAARPYKRRLGAVTLSWMSQSSAKACGLCWSICFGPVRLLPMFASLYWLEKADSPAHQIPFSFLHLMSLH